MTRYPFAEDIIGWIIVRLRLRSRTREARAVKVAGSAAGLVAPVAHHATLTDGSNFVVVSSPVVSATVNIGAGSTGTDPTRR